MSYVKQNTYRDFRIYSNRLQAVDDPDQSVSLSVFTQTNVMPVEKSMENLFICNINLHTFIFFPLFSCIPSLFPLFDYPVIILVPSFLPLLYIKTV
jgi:hypothetical protein